MAGQGRTRIQSLHIVWLLAVLTTSLTDLRKGAQDSGPKFQTVMCGNPCYGQEVDIQ